MATAVSAAEAIEFESTTNRTSLLELYTSEGCSSCPPAEAWLTGLKRSPQLWKQFVPIAFHVDYWDSLGWKDRFASKEFSDRQRAYASRWRAQSIYTPGFVMNGDELRGWLRGNALPQVNSNPSPVGVLQAASGDGVIWRLSFRPIAPRTASACDFHAVMLGFDLRSEVKAGENNGRRLDHDFVALDFAESAGTRQGESVEAILRLRSTRIACSKLGLAAWVTQADNPTPIQAVGGWINR
jgi:hypothetical protein